MTNEKSTLETAIDWLLAKIREREAYFKARGTVLSSYLILPVDGDGRDRLELLRVFGYVEYVQSEDAYRVTEHAKKEAPAFNEGES